jgi:hypothetical protein
MDVGPLIAFSGTVRAATPPDLAHVTAVPSWNATVQLVIVTPGSAEEKETVTGAPGAPSGG